MREFPIARWLRTASISFVETILGGRSLREATQSVELIGQIVKGTHLSLYLALRISLALLESLITYHFKMEIASLALELNTIFSAVTSNELQESESWQEFRPTGFSYARTLAVYVIVKSALKFFITLSDSAFRSDVENKLYAKILDNRTGRYIINVPIPTYEAVSTTIRNKHEIVRKVAGHSIDMLLDLLTTSIKALYGFNVIWRYAIPSGKGNWDWSSNFILIPLAFAGIRIGLVKSIHHLYGYIDSYWVEAEGRHQRYISSVLQNLNALVGRRIAPYADDVRLTLAAEVRYYVVWYHMFGHFRRGIEEFFRELESPLRKYLIGSRLVERTLSRELIPSMMMALEDFFRLAGWEAAHHGKLTELGTPRKQLGTLIEIIRKVEKMAVPTYYQFHQQTRLEVQSFTIKTKDKTLLIVPSPIVFEQGQRGLIRGANAQGKTTLLKTISGMLSEEIQVGPHSKILMPQRAEGKEPTIIHIGQRCEFLLKDNIVDELMSLNQYQQDQSQERYEGFKSQVVQLLDKLKIDEPQAIATVSYKQCSDGTQAKLMLASIMLSDDKPDILILDETLKCIDQQGVEAVWQCLKEYLPDTIILIVDHENRRGEEEFYNAGIIEIVEHQATQYRWDDQEIKTKKRSKGSDIWVEEQAGEEAYSPHTSRYSPNRGESSGAAVGRSAITSSSRATRRKTAAGKSTSIF